ncbi:unnamed protein product [Protopolystoma xenopodis]|uniref:Uncharacterized protein n=1 Tax=Protopolystoma xenopodis TaxID=117903 RepID=A0A3S5AX54_9PLAT|nr:unnamed protein product [Protopolystoma xenopodis]
MLRRTSCKPESSLTQFALAPGKSKCRSGQIASSLMKKEHAGKLRSHHNAHRFLHLWSSPTVNPDDVCTESVARERVRKLIPVCLKWKVESISRSRISSSNFTKGIAALGRWLK